MATPLDVDDDDENQKLLGLMWLHRLMLGYTA